MNPQYPQPGGYGQGPQQNYSYPSGDGQYDFIMGQGPQQKRPLIPGGDVSTRSRLILVGIILAAVVFLFIAGLITYNILTAGKKSYPQKLTGLLQTQQELIRVSGMGAGKGRSTAVRNKALNTNLTVLTDQTELTAIVKSTYKVKVNDKLLAAKLDKDNDEALNDAEASNTYDEVFLQILEQEIADYKVELQMLYTEATSAEDKDLIQRSYDHMELISKTEQ